MAGDDYLWDRSGRPDPDVHRLEQLLGRFRHRPTAAPRPRRRRRFALAAGLAAVVLVGPVLVWLGALGTGPGTAPRLLAGGRELRESEWVRTADAAQELRLLGLGEITVHARSELQVRRLANDETRLFLQRGGLDAFVYANARPRFFQVGTPAARCIDLGCRYTLTVGDTGEVEVLVILGQVSFESDGREVYVPAGATCRARPGRGAGTPRFEADAGGPFARALDRFDAAPRGRRAALARAVLAAATEPRQSLAVWHLLQDPETAVARAAVATLEARYGRPDGLRAAPGEVPGPRDREAWKTHLYSGWH